MILIGVAIISGGLAIFLIVDAWRDWRKLKRENEKEQELMDDW